MIELFSSIEKEKGRLHSDKVYKEYWPSYELEGGGGYSFILKIRNPFNQNAVPPWNNSKRMK